MDDTFNQLIKQAITERREHRLSDAHIIYSQALAHSRQHGTPNEVVKALKGLGQIERDLDNIEAARELYLEAVTLCRTEQPTHQLAHAIRHLGDIYQDNQQFELAEGCYQEALALYRKETPTPALDMANTLRPFALLKEKIADPTSAKELWQEALAFYTEVDVQAGMTECSSHLARLIN